MSEQLESVTQDTEIQDCAEEITGTLEAAFDLLLDRRDRQYAAAIAPLDVEEQLLRQEDAAIDEKARKHESTLASAARIARFEADRLTLEGESEKAAVKLEEMREAERAPANLRARQEEISNRIAAIEAEKSEVKARCDREFYADAQRIVRASERAFFLTLLDGIEKVLLPTDLWRNVNARINLTAPESGEIWRAAQKWYG
jgi:hypothetical protein